MARGVFGSSAVVASQNSAVTSLFLSIWTNFCSVFVTDIRIFTSLAALHAALPNTCFLMRWRAVGFYSGRRKSRYFFQNLCSVFVTEIEFSFQVSDPMLSCEQLVAGLRGEAHRPIFRQAEVIGTSRSSPPVRKGPDILVCAFVLERCSSLRDKYVFDRRGRGGRGANQEQKKSWWESNRCYARLERRLGFERNAVAVAHNPS